ncbi:MAG: hypothetical protein GY853_15695 [PVC group bacterium]|nr:hypothetical protein [PVC group bacterium]
MGIKIRKVLNNGELIGIEMLIADDNIYQEVYARTNQSRAIGIRNGTLIPGFNDSFVYEDIIEVETK